MARALIAVVASLALAASAGCGGQDSGGDTPLRLQLFGDAEEVEAYREVAQAYRVRTGRSVQLVAIGDRRDHLAKLSSAFAARRPPDVFLVNYRNIGPFVQRGGVDPAGPRLDAPGGMERADFEPVALDAFTVGGSLACLPQNVSSLVVYYNVDLFTAAGITPPRAGWSFSEFVAAARRLTRPSVRGIGLDPSLVRASPFVWGAGGEVADEAGERLALSRPASLRGLRAFISLRAQGLTPTRREAVSRPVDERFVLGEVAMLLSSRREVPALRATVRDFTWDVAPFPLLERPAAVLHSDAFCVARGPRSSQAHDFAQFAAGPVGARILARAGRVVPALRSVARSSAFLDPSSPPRSDRVFLDAVAAMRRLPNGAWWPRAEEIADAALEQAYYGERSLADAVAAAQDETTGARR